MIVPRHDPEIEDFALRIAGCEATGRSLGAESSIDVFLTH